MQTENWLCLGNNYIIVGPLDNSRQFSLLGGWNLIFVKSLLKIVHESFPFFGGESEESMGIGRGTPCVSLRTTRCPANHFSDKIFEARRRNLMMSLIVIPGMIKLRLFRLFTLAWQKVNLSRTNICGLIGRSSAFFAFLPASDRPASDK
jgi:hypothetical protein